MKESSIDGKDFDGRKDRDMRLKAGSYEDCQFRHLDLSKHDFRNASFNDCEFELCNLSSALLGNTALKDVRFNNCKMLGLDFNEVNSFLLAMSFQDCKLELASFRDLDLRACTFRDCQLREVDFSGADLSKVILDKCDLGRAIFENTTLVKADLQSSWDFVIDPSQNNTTGLILSKNDLSGLLSRFNLDIRE